MTVNDIGPKLCDRTLREQQLELLTRALASVELALVSRHLWPLDRAQVQKARDYLDALRDLMHKEDQ